MNLRDREHDATVGCIGFNDTEVHALATAQLISEIALGDRNMRARHEAFDVVAEIDRNTLVLKP